MMASMRLLRHILLLSLIIVGIAATSSSVEANTVRFGLMSGRSIEKAVKTWSPLIDYLSREVGTPFELVLMQDYRDIIDALACGELDMFEGGALSHITAMETGKAGILASEIRRGRKSYHSIFVVRENDDIETIVDAWGKRLALVDELSTSGYLIPRVLMLENGIDNPNDFFNRIVLTGSHDRSLEALREGAVDIIGIGDFILKTLPPQQRRLFRVIATSKPIPMGPITVRSDFDPEIARKTQEALLRFHEAMSAEIRQMMDIEEFFIQEESAYDAIRTYAQIAAHLTPLTFVTPYRHVPTIFGERVTTAKHNALLWMACTRGALILLLAVMALLARRGIAFMTGLTTAALVAVFAALLTTVQLVNFFATMDAFVSRKTVEIEKLNIRVAAALISESSRSLDAILKSAVQDEAVTWARIYRTGKVFASSDPREVGESVVNRVRYGTFDTTDRNIVSVVDPIILKDRQMATLQMGISLTPIQETIRRTIVTDIITMVAVLLTGGLIAIFLKYRFAKPVRILTEAVENIREGETTAIGPSDIEIKPVADAIERLGRDIVQRQELIGLAASDVLHHDRWDPIVTQELADRIQTMERENEAFRHLRLTQAMGSSPSWLRCLRDAAIRAHDRAPVVIVGPTGSGKTGVARVIHALSPRADKPMGEFNCAEFASGDPLIVLGKLFGYGEGSGIAGIDRRGQPGILEEFDGGTLFLDEVELIPMQAQQLLLLPLEGRPFNPAAGRGAARTVNVRFLFATNEPLENLVHSGRMRADLLRRIQARGVVSVPALAQRSEDIEMLAAHFLARRNASHDHHIGFTAETMHLLARCPFDRYNVSELMGTIDQAFDRARFEKSDTIAVNHIDGVIREGARRNPSEVSAGAAAGEAIFDAEEQRELAALRKHRFNITHAERALGYATGSKAMTNRFRGMVYAALERNAWEIEASIAQLAGPDRTPEIEKRLRTKIADYLATARRHLEANTTDRLFTKLPQKYHPMVEQLLEEMRKQS